MSTKKNKIKYNYIYVIYDIKEKRVNKVFKICKKYLEHYQNSVFRGEITESNLMKLKIELKNIINKDEDNILFLYYITAKSVILEEIGIKNNNNNFL
jgi:CRISPR-associated protein Cas2